MPLTSKEINDLIDNDGGGGDPTKKGSGVYDDDEKADGGGFMGCWARTCSGGTPWKFCKDCYLYSDSSFGAEPETLSKPTEEGKSPTASNMEFSCSKLKGMSPMEVRNNTAWLRADAFFKWQVEQQGKGAKEEEDGSIVPGFAPDQPFLFADDIVAEDVCQGALGDCWLMASFASLSEYPGSIQHCFKTMEYNPRGKYTIRLYDGRIKEWVDINVDDQIPVLKDEKTDKLETPLFANPSGCELWVMLLEKAFAKFCGGYSSLKGGHAMWGLQAMTGDNCFRLEFWPESDTTKHSHWERQNIKYMTDYKTGEPKMSTNPKDDWIFEDSEERFDDERVYLMVREYNDVGSIMCASRRGKGESKRADGIVQGHTYTLIDVKDVGGFRMLQLRNPWGSWEWNGAWSDSSDFWDKHPDVAKACKHENKDDGRFWMEWADFKKVFNVIQVCDRTTSADLHLDVMEATRCGVCLGCVTGCARFWFCCDGFKTIYCGHVTSDETIDVEQGICSCCCPKSTGKKWTKGNTDYALGSSSKL